MDPGRPIPVRLHRWETRELAGLGRLLAAQDPELARKLRLPPVRPRDRWAARAGGALLLAGVVMIASGFLFAASGVGAIGALMLMMCWLPQRLVQPDEPGSAT